MRGWQRAKSTPDCTASATFDPVVPSRRWIWTGVLAVLDAIAIASALHAHDDFHPGGGSSQPSVMTLGQALGWFASVVLTFVLVAVVSSMIRARNRRPNRRHEDGPAHDQ